MPLPARTPDPEQPTDVRALADALADIAEELRALRESVEEGTQDITRALRDLDMELQGRP